MFTPKAFKQNDKERTRETLSSGINFGRNIQSKIENKDRSNQPVMAMKSAR